MTPPITPIQESLLRHARGDKEAHAEIIERSKDRLYELARRMFTRYPELRRWETTDDVLQNALMDLGRTLEKLRVETTRDLFHLAARHIRHRLIDLVRHYFGPHGSGSHHQTPDANQCDHCTNFQCAVDDTPCGLLEWTEFHELIANLPAEEREVFDSRWYLGYSHEQTALHLGICLRTVKRRWTRARLAVMKYLGETEHAGTTT